MDGRLKQGQAENFLVKMSLSEVSSILEPVYKYINEALKDERKHFNDCLKDESEHTKTIVTKVFNNLSERIGVASENIKNKLELSCAKLR